MDKEYCVYVHKKIRQTVSSIAVSRRKPQNTDGEEMVQDIGACNGNISACCKGKVKHACGYVWKYI